MVLRGDRSDRRERAVPTDGTVGGVRLVKDISTTGFGDAFPGEFTPIGSTLYFTAISAAGRELWKTDGTTAGTVQVVDLNPGSGSTIFSELLRLNGVLYVGEVALMRSDGTAAGTTKVANIGDASSFVSPGDGSSTVHQQGPVGQQDVHPVRGTPAGTARVTDAAPGGAAFVPTALFAAGGRVYIVGTGGPNADRYELWRTDGTPGGADWVWDLQPKNKGMQPLTSYFNQGKYALAATPTQLLFPAYAPATGVEPYTLPLAVTSPAPPAPAVQSIAVNDGVGPAVEVTDLTVTFADRP